MSGHQAQPTQKYDVQPAIRGSSPWTDWAREVRNSQPDYKVSSSDTWHASAGGAHAWGQKWDSHPSEWNRPLLQPVRIWPGQIMTLTEIGRLAE